MTKPAPADGSLAPRRVPTRRPRVLHVLGGAGIGGMERQLLALLPHLAADTESTLILVRGGPLAGAFADTVPTRTIAKHGKVDPVCLARLVAAMRRRRPDIVHTWGSTANLWGGLAARIAGVAHLVVSDVSVDAWKGRTLRELDARIYRSADLVTGNSDAVVAGSVGRGADPARTAVVPNGVRTPDTVAVRADREPALGLFVGRLHPDNGPDLLVEAVPAVIDRVPAFHLIMAGPAEQPAERDLAAGIERRIAALGLTDRIDLMGPVSDPTPLLQRASLLVLPSRTEGSPNVVAEALAGATPVVATAVGGVPDLLEGGRLGRLVAPLDPAALADAIVGCINDAGGSDRMAALGRARVAAQLSLDVVASQWVGLYARCLDRAAADGR